MLFERASTFFSRSALVQLRAVEISEAIRKEIEDLDAFVDLGDLEEDSAAYTKITGQGYALPLPSRELGPSVIAPGQRRVDREAVYPPDPGWPARQDPIGEPGPEHVERTGFVAEFAVEARPPALQSEEEA